MGLARGRTAVGYVLLGALALVECRTPTEIVVHLSTDAPCGDVKGVQVRAGPAPSDVATTCDASGSPEKKGLGSIVVYPSGSKNDQVTLEAHLSLTGGGTCNEGDPGCIVARRKLRYVAHERLPLDIQLRQACAGVSCPDGTCVLGQCGSADVTSSDFHDEGDAGVSPLPDASPDGPGIVDAGPPDAFDASFDAGPVACANDTSPIVTMASLPTRLSMGNGFVVAASDTAIESFSRDTLAPNPMLRTGPDLVAAHATGGFAYTPTQTAIRDTTWTTGTALTFGPVKGLATLGADVFYTADGNITRSASNANVTLFASVSPLVGEVVVTRVNSTTIAYVATGDAVDKATVGFVSPYQAPAPAFGGPIAMERIFLVGQDLFYSWSDGPKHRLFVVNLSGTTPAEVDTVDGPILGIAATPTALYYTVQASTPVIKKTQGYPNGPTSTQLTPSAIGGMTGDGACIYFGATTSAGTGVYRLVPN